ncbi:serine acetyltransferase [Arachidicoccus ginsenosidivorans]|uniref:Serine acetyltransferase n=1 Tax=Arachidicoccus ginsenosidivorans TaxID=496057 RepID=A0A5B8VUF2_9BACT|nr:serine acetyltransferase [Arachidicoccus ginsenosidivorans]
MENFKKLKEFIYADLFRYTGRPKCTKLLLECYLRKPGFKFLFWMRCCAYYSKHKSPVFYYCKWRYLHYSYKFGLQIPYITFIDKGFYIGHFGNIIINQRAIIGKNCNISPGVVIGQSNRGVKLGVPTLKENVYVGPGAKLFGEITIGENVAIGANAVVVKDVPDCGVVVGVPAKVVSFLGSFEYINKKI